MSAHGKRRSSLRSVTDCLGADDAIARLTTHASRLLRLQQQLEAVAPKQLAAHVRIANYRLGKIVIHATNGAVAAKLRQLTPGLLNVFRTTGAEITEIEVKVQPSTHTIRQTKPRTNTGIGLQAKRGLTSLAQKLPEDDPLRIALERMIKSSRDATENKPD